ncbi:hypothetical protein [Pedobacter montanisoli]|uniref:DUF4149 domain-containing protein n=1 Tax=Pedobacter montanisoli TaxID=2923277 RepID=A0ABS9ZXE7_9SPHI|nr:hypothetical protein [Pedobacter montanisoli]MCJ0742983.1 hypothetical protein [Pedobacter montanisoli]
MPKNFHVKVPLTFIWIGFICAISFMEAWLKFQAPGITVTLGLGIGKLVFSALNKMEWIFAIAILTEQVYLRKKILIKDNLFYFIPLIILFIQTVWILPALDLRAEALIKGQALTPSNLHIWYVGLEVLKTICLAVFGIKVYTKNI